MFSMPQLTLVFSTKRVMYKQRDAHFFPPFAYAASFVLTQMPISTVGDECDMSLAGLDLHIAMASAGVPLSCPACSRVGGGPVIARLPQGTCPAHPALQAETAMYSIAVYWIVGLYRSPGNFFSWVCVLWSLSNCEWVVLRRRACVHDAGCTAVCMRLFWHRARPFMHTCVPAAPLCVCRHGRLLPPDGLLRAQHGRCKCGWRPGARLPCCACLLVQCCIDMVPARRDAGQPCTATASGRTVLRHCNLLPPPLQTLLFLIISNGAACSSLP